MCDVAASTNGATGDRKEPAPSLPFSIWSILRVVAVSLAVTHGIALCLWVGVSSLCGDVAGGGDTCPRHGHGEAGGGSGGMRRVLCRSGGAAASKAWALLPLLPSLPDDEVGTASSCPSAMGADDDAGDEEKDKKKNPIARFFDRRRRRKSKVAPSRSGQCDDDTEVLKEVVSKHRSNPGIVDKRHPIKRVVHSAATFFRRRKARKAESAARAELKPGAKEKAKARTAQMTQAWAKDAAFDGDLRLTAGTKKVVETVASKVREVVDSDGNGDGRTFDDRVAAAGWGGPVSTGGRPWWLPAAGGRKNKGEADGTSIVSAYLKIMHWPSSRDTEVHFPFKLCADGCSADVALVHTLEWREKFRPWCITPSAVKENKDGFFVVRGYSPPPQGVEDKDIVGHTLVFYRPGLHPYDDTEAYLRIIMHSLDAAVADSYARSNDKIGKYNIVLDCNDFKFSMIPNLHDVKRLFVMMQDHFPDRLGILLITNLGGAAQLFLKMVKPLITEAVRNKIHVLPNADSEQGREMLTSLVDEAYIPTWLGGTDDFIFDAKAEYSKRLCTEEEGREYLTNMPYHA